MIRFTLTAFFILASAAQAAPIGRVDVRLAPGVIQLTMPEKTDTTSMTLTITNANNVTRTIRSAVGPTKPFITARVIDTASTFTVTLFNDDGTTVTGPARITTLMPEDYALGAESGAAFRALMLAAEGPVRYDAVDLQELTTAQKKIVETRVRVIMRELARQKSAAIKARIQAQADALKSLDDGGE